MGADAAVLAGSLRLSEEAQHAHDHCGDRGEPEHGAAGRHRRPPAGRCRTPRYRSRPGRRRSRPRRRRRPWPRSCSCPKLMVSGSSAEQPSPASAKATMPSRGCSAGSDRDDHEDDGQQEGKHVVGPVRREPALDQANSTRPTVTMPRTRSARAMPGWRTRAGPWSCPAGTSSRSSSRKAVQDGERGEHPERRGILRGHGRSRPAARAPASSGRRRLTRDQRQQQDRRHDRQPPPEPRPTKMATNTGARAVPSPRRAFRTRTEPSTRSGWNAAVKVLMRRHGEAEPGPQAGRGGEQQPVGERLLAGEELADDQQRHRHQVGHRPARNTRLVPNR